MTFRGKLAVGAAGLAGAAVLAVPLGLTQGGGTVDVFVGSTPTPTATPTATPGAYTTANLWVDGAGTCTRQSTAGAYSNAGACATIDNAWDAASNGDRICISPGTYNGQSITGNKTSPTLITGNCGGAVTVQAVSITDPCPGGVDNQGAAICTTANFAIFERFTVDGLNDHGYSTTMQVRGDDTEIRYMHFTASGTGSTSFWDLGEDAYVHHNDFDEDDATPYQRSCNIGDGQPIQFEANTGVRFEYNHIWQQGSDQTPCSGSSNGFHLDVTRWQSSVAPIICHNRFEEAEAGTGYIFLSGTNSGSGGKICGNYFAKNTDGSNWMQVRGDTIGASCPIEMMYNTFYDGYAIIDGFCDPITGGKLVGNTGLYQGCGGTVNTANVWWRSSSATCSGNTILTGGTLTSTLGIGADGRPTSGSSAVVNAAETPGASDYCTDSAYLDSVDLDGNARPFGGNSKCSAGAYEWAG